MGGVRQTEEEREGVGEKNQSGVVSFLFFFFKKKKKEVKEVIPRQEFKHQQKACSSFKTSSRKRVPLSALLWILRSD